MSEFTAVVDRFENDCAVLLVGQECRKLVLPRDLLPVDSREGSTIKITLTVDHRSTQEAASEIADLIKRLDTGEM